MYTWQGMKKISKEEAVEKFNSNVEVFLLYDDDTEAVIYSLAEIEEHDGEYGIHK